MKRIGLLFYVKKAKLLSNGTTPIYVRITIDEGRVEIATKRYIDPKKWNTVAQKVTGHSEEVKRINSYLKTLEQDIYDTHQLLVQEGKAITAEALKNRLTGKKKSGQSLMALFQEHNEQLKALVGQEYAKGTLERYETSFRHTRSFMQWKYGVADIDIQKLDYAFISGYAFWLKSVRKCNHNSTMKYLGNFRKIVNKGIRSGWLSKDPFADFKLTKREVVRAFLSEEELARLTAKEFGIERLNQVRDIFLFSCYTGLAYADVKKLKRSEIVIGVDGEQWIFTSRQKTDTPSRIPLLPVSLAIVKRYEAHQPCIIAGKLLPVLSNQKMNAYLKEIADVCGIQKHLTYHIARHTFATTVTLTNGVSIESVSKMLGHKSLRITQHYAKILDQKVSADMQALKQKLSIVQAATAC